MSLVFDGIANTVAGLAVGGLGTGVVDTATLAAAAVTAPKTSGAQTGSAPIYGCRAWAYFNGTTAGTNAPQAGGNVTNITRNSVGNYTANFTTAMPDTFIALSGSSGVSTVVCLVSSTTTSATFSVNSTSTGAQADASAVNVMFIR